MKNKFLVSALFLLLVVGLYTPASYSQVLIAPIPHGTVILANETQYEAVDPGPVTQYEFDVYLLRTGTDPWEMSGIQLGLQYNYLSRGGHAMTATWVAGTTDAIFVTSGQAPGPGNVGTVVGNVGVIKVSAKLPSGGYGTGAVISNVGNGSRLGRMRLTCALGFVNQTPDVGFNTVGTPLYPTQPGAYVANDQSTETNVDMTANTTFTNTLANGILPVELSSFSSTAQGRSVVLSWSTKTEKNSDRFEVERSLVSNSVWSTIASVKASVLSNSPKNYTYTDNKLQSGKYQYRLKMVDNNGTFSYSSVETAVVAIPKDFAVSQNYPNPFNPSTKIDYQVPVDSKAIMEVYNIAGQRVSELVNQNQTAGYYTVDFGATKLSSGVYIYRIVASEKATGKNFSSIKKMILTN